MIPINQFLEVVGGIWIKINITNSVNTIRTEPKD